MTETMSREELVEKLLVYGNEWEKAGHHRIYFNDLPKLYGLKVNRYNTGNISCAWIDGEMVSNSEGGRIMGRLYDAKLWWDYADGQFHGKGIEQDDFDRIVANVKNKIGEVSV